MLNKRGGVLIFKFLSTNNDFTKIASINLFSRLGDRLFYISMLNCAALVSQSTLAITLVSFSETIPLLLSFLLGSVSDRQKNKSRILIKNSIIRCLIYVTIGLIFYHSTNFLIILLVSILNLISGILGNYSSALITPFTKILVNNNDMEKAQGIIAMTSELINAFSTLMGSILIIFFLNSTIAFINAFIFLIVSLLFVLIRSTLNSNEKKIMINRENISIFETIRNNFFRLFNNKELFDELFQLSLLNGFFGGLTPIFVLSLQKNNINSATRPIMIALLSVVITLGMIIGNFYSSRLLRNRSNATVNKFSNILIIFIGIGLIFNNMIFVLCISSILAFNLGIVSPRFTSKIINFYSIENLGGIITTVNSLLLLTPPITAIVFPSISNVSLYLVYIMFIVYGLFLIVMSKVILKDR